MEREETPECRLIIDQVFPWLFKMSGFWMAVNFYARRDFTELHNGFPRLPFPLPRFAKWLHILSRDGFVLVYRTAPFDEPQDDFVPSIKEFDVELSRPQTGPSRDFGRLVASMSEDGTGAILKRRDHYGVSSAGWVFSQWTRDIFIPTILPTIQSNQDSSLFNRTRTVRCDRLGKWSPSGAQTEQFRSLMQPCGEVCGLPQAAPSCVVRCVR